MIYLAGPLTYPEPSPQFQHPDLCSVLLHSSYTGLLRLLDRKQPKGYDLRTNGKSKLWATDKAITDCERKAHSGKPHDDFPVPVHFWKSVDQLSEKSEKAEFHQEDGHPRKSQI